MRILVTGGRGQLGATLADLDGWGGHSVVALGHDQCDITDAASVRTAMEAHRPDAVINAAAWTRVDDAEVEAAAAWALNADAPRLLAEACAAAGALLTHLSTDYVVPGDIASPTDETQTPSPRSAYGRSKLAGEEAVRGGAAQHQVVRTSWLYGRDGPNFVLTMLRVARQGRSPRVVADQTGAPTWTGHLAPALLRLVERGDTGTFHLSNSGATTWHGFANAIFEGAGLAVRAEAITTAEYPTRAERPQYSVLDNAAWRHLGEPPLPPWSQGLAEYLAELRSRGALGTS